MLVALMAWSCGSSSSSDAVASFVDVPVTDVPTADVPPKPDGAAPGDGVGPDSGLVPLPAVPDPCVVGDDCPSGWCVEGPDGHFCSEVCISECPKGWTCKGVTTGGPLVFLCVPLAAPVCADCATDAACP